MKSDDKVSNSSFVSLKRLEKDDQWIQMNSNEFNWLELPRCMISGPWSSRHHLSRGRIWFRVECHMMSRPKLLTNSNKLVSWFPARKRWEHLNCLSIFLKQGLTQPYHYSAMNHESRIRIEFILNITKDATPASKKRHGPASLGSTKSHEMNMSKQQEHNLGERSTEIIACDFFK